MNSRMVEGVAGLLVAAALMSGGASADERKDTRAAPAAGFTSQGVVESIASPDPAGAPLQAGNAAAQEADKDTDRGTGRRWVVRIRLDDGRYLGFHQPGGDELRVGDRVQIEDDRIQRARETGAPGK